MRPDAAGKGRKRGNNGRRGDKKPNTGSNSSFGADDVVSPPMYPRKEHKLEHFDDVRVDPFYWLRDRRNPEVRRLLQRENAHMESVFAAYGGDRLCRTLFSEMRARWKEEDASLPYRDRDYWYYTRTVPNADHPIFCRRPFTEHTAGFMHEVAEMWNRNPTATLPFYDDEAVYLDMNLLMKELRLGYVELGDLEVSSDGQRLALTLDCSNGKELFTIFLLDITDVNYVQWLNGRSEMHRAWVEVVMRSDRSIYASPVSILPTHRSPTTPTGSSSSSGASGGTSRVGGSAHAMRRNMEKKHALTSSTPLSFTSLSTTTPTTVSATASTQRGEPAHKILRRIEVFDAADEVLWLSPTSLLYLGVDGKMRSCRVIYHDLTAPVNAEQADIICYEEADEAFWVSSLCFSADGRFAMFTVASGSCTEVYVIPCEAGVERCVNGVPVAHTAAKAEGEEFHINKCAVHCFADRHSGMDYDVDHHDSLFRGGPGSVGGDDDKCPAGTGRLSGGVRLGRRGRPS
ncbi:putative oligopeptidase B, putative,serine peptidase, clan SC, family S9A-like protein [Trypanosoma rangeli]|uniref:Putative oligopeptidase B, putative,serine peptidase, clan SC, family S9A-like protein n=1 Tax=Trypanosoma rangeli TaxID=5698 RepID=A0A3R7MZL2_TRYRA|nr:putative oligopeptidase B, putative,serine peptidase, clan SC, family S9A-like protein [Trypanosoma rangeli]RNF10484.1 putative oligopeptidase B, putative,serine peptidase, clan SC, family S9A-like protein [Trypanosoma rangeli]|eukprot:RNF10484.1 putative oligopeptidase B, putative,serine peptidase, clan SC, family S9A-like protein [Trypanosoma rangeli]